MVLTGYSASCSVAAHGSKTRRQQYSSGPRNYTVASSTKLNLNSAPVLHHPSIFDHDIGSTLFVQLMAFSHVKRTVEVNMIFIPSQLSGCSPQYVALDISRSCTIQHVPLNMVLMQNIT
jgi:hypothetical protein